jgi:heme-degrading monooxygenase HmoA
MGGYGAMHLALKYPEIFGAVVAQGGFYSVEIDGFQERWIFPLASVNPTNWSEFDQLFWERRTALSYISGACPNPNNPPFFLDMPCEMVAGKAQLVPEVWQRMKDYDIVHGHLPPYVKKPVKLNAIMFVHGVEDQVLSVDHARSLDRELTKLGIEHVYDEHNGGHEFIAEKSLQFLSQHLSDHPVQTGKTSTPQSQGGVTMFTRFTIAQVKSGKMDELAQIYTESIVPAAKAQKGYRGAYLLTNTETGKAISITVWDSEADAIANEQSGYYQEQVAKAKDCFAALPVREGYEITVADTE